MVGAVLVELFRNIAFRTLLPVCPLFITLCSTQVVKAEQVTTLASPRMATAPNQLFSNAIAQNAVVSRDANRALNPLTNPVFDAQFAPVPGFDRRYTSGERMRLNALGKLPARLVLDANVESSFRYELNPFQFPGKRTIKRKFFPSQQDFFLLDPSQQSQLMDLLNTVNKDDVAFRVIPNVTAGWMLTPRTKIFANYFFIRDTFLGQDHQLSTTSHSVSGGIHNDRTLGKRFTLSTDCQFRELFVEKQQPLFDFLPSITLGCQVTPRTSVFASGLLQLRGTKYFAAPTVEIDPFYTLGVTHQRGPWTFSSSGLFVTNYRSPFLGPVAQVNQDPFAFILDSEISRPISRRVPSLRGFVRAEHIFNLNTQSTPGSAGYDFRLFWGARMAVGKQSEYAFIKEIERQLREKEGGQSP